MKMFLFLKALQKGSELAEPEKWKNRAQVTMALSGLIMVLVQIAKVYGYDLPIGSEEATLLAGAIAVLVGMFFNWATSRKVGVPTRELPPDSGSPNLPEETPVSTGKQDMLFDRGVYSWNQARAFVLVLGLAFLISGCANFGNRLACTPGKDKAFVVSEYGGRIGVATKVDERDAGAVCK